MDFSALGRTYSVRLPTTEGIGGRGAKGRIMATQKKGVLACPLMEHGFSRSVPMKDRLEKLYGVLDHDDTLAILISADPDAIGSAMALKRLCWRKVRSTAIFNTHPIRRGDNMAMVRLTGVKLRPIKEFDPSKYNRLAIVDSQPHHNAFFEKLAFHIIVDHHPLGERSKAPFVDIRPHYGATSTIFTEYLKTARVKPSAQLAAALFYGIKTDTMNFVRGGIQADMVAFRYLFGFTNMNVIRSIENSEITKASLTYYRKAMVNLKLWKQFAYTHLGKVPNSDICVQVADLFLKLAEASWSIASAVVGQKLVVIFRTHGYRRNAGQLAEKLFSRWGRAGGHKTMGRAEVPLKELKGVLKDENEAGKFVYGLIRRHSRAVKSTKTN
jgi:nanoRNase/pAp phosphatase (c-di-AMP/oligoRNAs hydrolase)